MRAFRMPAAGSSAAARWAWVAGAAAIFALTYVLAVDEFGNGLLALSVFHVLLAGWLLGWRGGTAVGLLNVVLLAALAARGEALWEGAIRSGGFSTALASVAVGASVGLAADLRRRLLEQADHIASLVREQQRGRLEAKALARAARILSEGTARGDVLEAILEAAWSVVPAQGAALFMLDRDSKVAEVIATSVASRQMMGRRMPTTKGVVGRALRTRATQLVTDVRTDPDYVDTGLGFRSEIVVPIALDDEILGILDFEQPDVGGLTADDARVLGEFAQYAATALAIQRLLRTAADRTDELEAANERRRYVERATNDAVYDWDVATDGLIWSDAIAAFGTPVSDVVPTLGWWLERIHPEDVSRVERDLAGFMASGSGMFAAEYRFKRSDGTYAHVLDRGWIIRDVAQVPVRMIGSMQDITERREAEERLRSSEAFLRKVLDASLDAVVAIDASGRITEWNAQAETTFGWTRQEAIGRQVASTIIPSRHRAAHFSSMERYLTTGAVSALGRRIEIEAEHRDGHEIPVELAIAALELDGDRAFSAFIRDLTGAKHAQRILEHTLLHDHLTELPNRVLIQRTLGEALKTVGAGQDPALLVLDLDRFQEVNDTFGPAAGDALLMNVAERLSRSVTKRDTVGRLGSDEFAVVLAESSAADARQVAATMLAVLDAPFEIEGNAVSLTASIGIALATRPLDPDAVMRQAELAMRRAKRSRSGIEMYAAHADEGRADRLTLASDLRAALEQGALRLVYQPIIPLTDGGSLRFEVLARWDHPTRGAVPPSDFVGIAEQTGLIRPLTRWAMRTALEEMKRWSSNGVVPPVSLNVSIRDLLDPTFPAEVSALLAETSVDPEWLGIELTETLAMAEPERTIRALQEIRSVGVAIAIDDFGTGHSSLAYLHRIPSDSLKIDRSFVSRLLTGTAGDIVRGAIDLGHSCGLQVVAEGVEDQPTLDRLVALGCDAAQGYHIGRPLPPDEVPAWIRTWLRHPLPLKPR